MKKVIITGASSGLGYEIASKLVDKGVKVVNLSRTPANLSVINIKTDLAKNSDIKKAIEIINKDHKDANVLILCAGVLHWHKTGENPIDEIDEDFAVNITGSIKLTDGVMPIIKKNEGDVVVVGSTSSFICYPESSVYNATKHAVLGFIKSLQSEYKKENVRIIGFHPGGFRSQLHIKAGSDVKQENLMDPKDLANLILFTLNLPRNIEISEIIINRKKPKL